MSVHLALVLVPLLTLAGRAALDDPADDRAPQSPAAQDARAALESPGLRIERGDELSFVIPDHEVLEFAVVVDIAVLGSTGMGSFQLSAGTEPYAGGAAGKEDAPRKLGWIRGRAMGNYLNYELDHVIEARVLPQAWPHVIYRDTQQGTENRRRELMYGEREGAPWLWYRQDKHCKKCERAEHMLEGTWPFTADRHCEGCRRAEHRAWRNPVTLEVPAHSVDMLSSVHLARSLVREGLDETTFAMLDEDSYWNMTFVRGERGRIEVPAGAFACRAIKLLPELPEREEGEEDKFEGLFGMHGTLSIWLEERTGVPVKIEGLVHAGPLEVDVALNLKSFEGTPAAFGPLD